MNWGYKILIVYIAFVLGIIFMVFRSSSQNTELVTKDYYEKELLYQQRIDAMNRVEAMPEKLVCQLKDGKLQVQFPSVFVGKQLKGEAVLYCPSDKKGDLQKSFSIAGQNLELAMPVAGNRLYELQLSWEVDGQSYYFSKKIFV